MQEARRAQKNGPGELCSVRLGCNRCFPGRLRAVPQPNGGQKVALKSGPRHPIVAGALEPTPNRERGPRTGSGFHFTLYCCERIC